MCQSKLSQIHLTFCLYFCAILLLFREVQSVSPIFQTNLPSCKTGKVTLVPATYISSTIDYSITAITFPSSFSVAPAIGLGIGYIEMSYSTEFLFDAIATTTSTGASINCSRTTTSVSGIWGVILNYIAVNPSTSFSLQISTSILNFSSTTLLSSNLTVRSYNSSLTYRLKSNTSNARVALSVVGMQIYTDGSGYTYQIDNQVVETGATTFTVLTTVQPNNRVSYLRVTSVSYETVYANFDPPYYLTFQTTTDYAKTITLATEFENVTSFGNIFTGLNSWRMSNTNASFSYNFTFTKNTYNIIAPNIPSSQNVYIWLREETCPSGYILIPESHTCPQCHYSCTTCTGTSSTECLSCNTGVTFRNRNDNNECLCQTDYKDVGAYICIKITCSIRCGSCADIDECKTCNPLSRRELINKDCVCNKYTVENVNPSEIVCDYCHYSCYTCSEASVATKCLSCNITIDYRSFVEQNKTCTCTTGYYESGTKVCAKCNRACQTCTNSSKCLTCDPNKGRIEDTTNTSNLFCICATGFDDLINEQCKSCKYSCESCTNETACTKCPSTRNLTNFQCPCLAGFYDNGVSKECQPCKYSCLECNNADNCSACSLVFHRMLNSTTLLCYCTTGYYDNEVSQECLKCNDKCLTCTNGAINGCKTCRETDFRTINATGNCACQNGYFEEVSTSKCSSCHHSCQTCTGVHACVSCDATRNRQSIVNSTSGYCDCASGFYDVGNQTCVKCPNKCLTCNSASSCLTCESTTRVNGPLCLCKDETYDDGSDLCKPCKVEYHCKTCTNPTNCTSCFDPSRTLSSTGECICSEGYFGANCDKCHFSCKTCSTSFDNCVKCDSSKNRYLKVDAGQGNCLCYDGYYNDGTALCKPCSYSCLTCSESLKCTNCPLNRVKNLTDELCYCTSEYYENNAKNCMKCHYSCAQCSSELLCTNCSLSQHRISDPSGSGLCICSIGYFDNGVDTECRVCDKSCKTCKDSSDKCESCDSALFREIDTLAKKCLCFKKYYESTDATCTTCSPSCETCSGPSSCLTCVADRVKNIDTGLCDCKPGKIENTSTGQCEDCMEPCESCKETLLKCLSCQSTYTFNPSENECYCADGTFENYTSCETCLSTCQTCDNSSTCSFCRLSDNRELFGSPSSLTCECKDGFYSQMSSSVCIKCHYSCETCTESTSCQTCKTGRDYINTTSYCACPQVKYFDNGVDAICQNCEYNCKSCNKISSNCTVCDSGKFRRKYVTNENTNLSTCICMDKYFAVPNVEACTACHYSCSTCNNETACFSCDILMHRISLAPNTLCSCSDGYFDVSLQHSCNKCNYVCKTCSATNNNCLTCHSTRIFTANSCPCRDGYYDSLVNNEICQTCQYLCKTCTNSTSCFSCPETTRILNSSSLCECKPGYFDAGELECRSCSLECEKCSVNATTCTKCFDSQNRELVENMCVCKEGFFNQGSPTNKTCSACHYSCQRCISSTECASCNSLKFRERDTNGLCSCIGGYFSDGVNEECKECRHDCLTCSEYGICILCPSERQKNALNECECKSDYYENNTQCEKCPPECETCSSLSVCLTCNNPTQRTLNNGLCICNDKLYPTTSSSQECTACHYSCKTCIAYPRCGSCSSDAHRALSFGQCKCEQKYFDLLNTETCQPCDYSCLTCISGSACETCDTTAVTNRVFNETTHFCSCRVGFFEDPTSKVCIKCMYSCEKCINSNTCETCVSTSGRTLFNGQCVCSEVGYFDDKINIQCQQCDPLCYQCSNTKDSCTDCNTDETLRVLVVDKCVCTGNNFEPIPANPICLTCNYYCLTCSSIATCLTCEASYNRIDSSDPNKCPCDIGFYDDGKPQCEICDYRCETCTNGNSCATCHVNSYRSNQIGSPFCICIGGYFSSNVQNDYVCQKCSHSCVTCNHPTLCLTCINDGTRFFQNNICKCSKGYYDDGSNVACIKCPIDCETCTSPNACQNCSSLNNRVFNSTTGKCHCKQGYYDIGAPQCFKCDSSCKTCTNGNSCETCPDNTNQYINITESPFCICKYGFFKPNGATICKQCSYACERCSSSESVCIECDAAAHRYLSAGSCLCKENYFDTGSAELCGQCNSPDCLNCYNSLSGQCYQCKPNTYLYLGACETGCPDAFYEYSPTWSCLACNSSCIDCINGTSCNKCGTSFYLLPKPLSTEYYCTNTCPKYYYKSPTHCLPCISPCLQCSGVFSCIDCIPGFYKELKLSDSACYPCYSTCRYCNNSTVKGCITCADGYYKNETQGLCVKLTCGSEEYVSSVDGCSNCALAYPNSLQCNSEKPLSCKPGYQLITTPTHSCIKCNLIPGYTLIPSTNLCEEICGDGMRLNAPCDDANTLNGDGCSSTCNVEENWECNALTNGVSTCDIPSRVTLKATVESVVKVQGANKVKIIIIMNVGVRLLKVNFVISFGSGQKFEYSATTLNNKFTRYLLEIEYFQSVQKEKLSINILSPAPSTSASNLNQLNSSIYSSNRQLSTTSRLLPDSELLSQIEIPLSIDIELLLELEIETLPPALYYSSESREVYTTAFFITLIVIHVLTLLTLVYFIFILRIKSMLFTIELLNFITLLYIYSTYGLYNISELTTESARALQYFIHKFGDDLPLRYLDTSAGYFGFGSFIISGCIIQLVIITICAILKLFSHQTTSNKNVNSKQSIFNYYHLALTLTFLPDFMLSIIIIFKWVDIHSSIQSSYSWGIALILLIMILMTNGIYIINSYAYVKVIKSNIKNYEKRENNNTNAFVQIYDKESVAEKEIQGIEEDEDNGFDNKNTGANFMNSSIEKPQIKNDESFDPFAEEMSIQRSQKSQKTNRSTNFKAKKAQPSGETEWEQENRTEALGGASARKYASSNKQIKSNSETSSLQSNRTNSSKSSTISLLANSPLIPLYDLTPTEIISNSISFSHNQINDSNASVHRILLHHTYLPLKCVFLTVIICIFSQIQEPISRCTLLIFCQIATIVYLCLTTRIKNVRTIKLLIMSCILMGISICGLASAIITRVTTSGSWLISSGDENDSLYILEGVIIGLILFGVTGNVALYILQIVKSQEYWQYKIDKKNEEIIEKNQRKNRLRNVGLNYIHDDSNLNMNKANSGFASGIKNIFSSFKFNDSYNEHTDKNETKQHLQLDSEINTPAEYNQNTSNILGGLGNSRKDNFAIVDIEDMNLEEEFDKDQRENQSDMRIGTIINKSNSQTSFAAHMTNNKNEHVQQGKGRRSGNESSSPSKNKSRLSRGIEENIHESYGGNDGKNREEQSQNSPGKISRGDKSRLELERKRYNESYKLDREKELMIYTNEHIHENSEEESSQDHPHLQSTRVKEEHFKNPHMIIHDKESRQNKRNDFMSRLESELIGEEENDTTFVVAYKKNQRISEEEEMNRENTLISDQSLELKSPPRKNKNVPDKPTKKSYQLNKNMIPTRENETLKKSKSRSPPKNNKTPPRNKNLIKSGSPNRREESIETQELEEIDKYQEIAKGNQKHYQYGLAGKMSNSKEKTVQRQEKIEEGNLGLNKNIKSTIEVRSKEKNTKLKRAETNPSELMKIQNKSPKQKQDESDEDYEEIEERKYKFSSKAPLPDGIKSAKHGGLVSKNKVHDASIGEEEYIIDTKMGAKRGSPHKGRKIKRIDSISSIGSDNEGDYPFYEHGEEGESEGASVFKKLLKDYEVYRNKKIIRNSFKKR